MQIIQHRRALHQIPELDRDLPETLAYLRKVLTPLGCALSSPIPGALCAFFDFGQADAIAFRSDADALPIQEYSSFDGAVLAAMNVADKYCKERAVSDNLRAQLKQALDENARLARELSEAKREGRKASRGGRPPKQPPAEPAKPAGEEG